jgi:uncharacterized protein (DUF305 family)
MDKAYGRLGLMAALHFAAMYGLMYAMADRLADVLPNLNQAYMAGLMTAPMLIFELLLMGSMYPRKPLNMAIVLGGVVLLAGSFAMIRQQTAIGDAQFLRSMIPHHSGAILMCEKANLRDPDIRKLCGGIVAGQQAEIDWMRAKLRSTAGR